MSQIVSKLERVSLHLFVYNNVVRYDVVRYNNVVRYDVLCCQV